MTEWQLIETAPKDKTHILAYGKLDPASDYEVITTVYWDSSCILCHYWALVAVVNWVEGDDFYPTHWMPLPKPPKEKTDD
jgi:hypothetical protein